MEKRGLIFIPDISGFTRFVNETEIEHSRQIIQELLETIINANEIGLEISEIEGDAILFYKYGEAPDLKELYKQVEKMFCEFHRHLIAYEKHRLCQCTACKSAANLTLKVISHYGEFTGYNVKNFSKLIGKDIIVAHQLLKNDIEQHEYWLVTEGLMKNESPELRPWMNWNTSMKQTDTGQIPYQYTQLSPLKNEIPPASSPPLEIPKKVKVFSVSKEFKKDINTLFFSAVNFNFRGRWQVGVKSADQVSHILPQVGTHHRCVLEKGEQVIMYTSSFSYEPEKIIYSETAEDKKNACYFTFEKVETGKTRVTIDFYLKKNPLMQLMFNIMMKKKIEQGFRQSLENLDEMVKDIRLPVEGETV